MTVIKSFQLVKIGGGFFFRNSNEWFWPDVRRGLWIKICISELPGRAAAGQVIKSVACERRTEDSLQLSFKMISHNKETHFKFTKLSARSVFMFLIFFQKTCQSVFLLLSRPIENEWIVERGEKNKIFFPRPRVVCRWKSRPTEDATRANTCRADVSETAGWGSSSGQCNPPGLTGLLTPPPHSTPLACDFYFRSKFLFHLHQLKLQNYFKIWNLKKKIKKKINKN